MNESTLPCDEHDGIDLWRKYADMKRYVINQITPRYNKCLGKDGLIPPGKSKEEVLLMTRELLFKSEQDTVKTKSKNPRDFTPDWYSSSSQRNVTTKRLKTDVIEDQNDDNVCYSTTQTKTKNSKKCEDLILSFYLQLYVV